MESLNKSQKRLLIILAVVVVGASIDFFMNMDSYLRTYSGGSDKQQDSLQKKSPGEVAIKDTAQDYLSQWGKDPFYITQTFKAKRKVLKKEKKLNLFLHAISMQGDNSVALINEYVLKEGDMVSGFKIKKIKNNSVTLSNNQKTIYLTLDNKFRSIK